MIDYLKYWSDIEKSLDFIRDTYTLPNDIIEDDEVSTIDLLHPWVKVSGLRGLSQKVIDFLYNKKTIWSIALKFYVSTLPLFLHYH